MRKHIAPVGLGLLFLLTLGVAFPTFTSLLAPSWPTSSPGIAACWIVVGSVVTSRRACRKVLDSSLAEVAYDALVLSLVAAAAGIQLLPELASLGLLELAGQAFGDMLLKVTAAPLLLTSFAYLIAPQCSLVQADHPVQYRDRKNAAKFLLGVAGGVLLYKLIAACV